LLDIALICSIRFLTSYDFSNIDRYNVFGPFSLALFLVITSFNNSIELMIIKFFITRWSLQLA